MNVLLDPLPEFVEIDGSAWPINSCFTVGITFELIMQNNELSPTQKVERALELYYPELPPNLPEAMNRLLWFYGCGNEVEGAKTEDKTAPKPGAEARHGKRTPKAYCFEQDADLILSAFWECYGIDLNAIEGLHWWKFRALFIGLRTDCRLMEVMGYRTADTQGMTKKQKQHYERLKKLYALKNQTDVASALTLAERDRRMKEYVARRFEEVGAINN